MAARAVAEGENREKITLQCVRSGGKLRIRFHSFTNAAGKTYGNVYNNSYNCQFPRDIRQEGRYFEIGGDDLTLCGGGGKAPFYRVRTNNIKILANGPGSKVVNDDAAWDGVTPPSARSTATAAERPEQVFEVNECVICLEGKPEEIFIPCAHLCSCSGCYMDMKKAKKAVCPLCRRAVVDTIKN